MPRFLAFAIVGLMIAITSPAFATVVIDVTYEVYWTTVGFAPGHKSESVRFHLSGTNRIDAGGQGTVLGGSFASKNKNGADMVSSFKVRRGDIVNRAQFNGSTLTTRVHRIGEDGCSATLKWSRLRGHEYFEDHAIGTGAPLLMTDMHAENIVCRIHNE